MYVFLFDWILELDDCCFGRKEWNMKNPKWNQIDLFRVYFSDIDFMRKTVCNKSNRE